MLTLNTLSSFAPQVTPLGPLSPDTPDSVIMEQFGDNLLVVTGDGYYAVFDALGLVKVTASRVMATDEFWRVCQFD